MPQKKNPDTAELIRGKSGTVIGSLMGLISICKALPLSYNRDLQEATPNLWRAVETTRGAVRVMAGIFDTININTDSMALQSVMGFTTATELADTMVRAAGIPFRTAHQIVGVLARGNGDPTLEDIDSVAMDVLGEKLSDRGMSQEMLKEALDPLSNIRKRNITGGPSPDETDRAIRARSSELETEISSIAEMNKSIEDSLKILLETVESCIDEGPE
jgi:argininosuccinate lyase